MELTKTENGLNIGTTVEIDIPAINYLYLSMAIIVPVVLYAVIKWSVSKL